MAARRLLLLFLTLAWGCSSPSGAKPPGPPAPPSAVVVAASTPRAAPAPAPVSAATAPAAASEEVSFLAFGDLTLARKVARAIEAADDPLLPFRSLEELLRSVDFSFANLESPFDASAARDHELGALLEYRFRVVNFANNHAMDRGEKGLRFTLSQLHGRSIETVGAGDSLADAWRPAVVAVGGVNIAFVGASYTSVNISRHIRVNHVARMDHRFRMRAAFAQLPGSGADFVVATMHAGIEYVSWPTGEQRRFAHEAIDLGADVVFGSHPHVVQQVERYRGKYIFYSLGNFIFDQHRPPQVKESAAVRTVLRKTDRGVVLSHHEVIPIVNDDVLTPRRATGERATRILRRMGLRRARLEMTSPDHQRALMRP